MMNQMMRDDSDSDSTDDSETDSEKLVLGENTDLGEC